MAKLVCKKHGKIIKEIELVEGQEYTAGRDAQASIPLEGEKGISRLHFKVSFENEEWVAELTSKYGSLFVDGEQAAAIALQNNVIFNIPPYEFLFCETQADEDNEDSNSEQKQVNIVPLEKNSDEANLDATFAGTNELIPFLKIHLPHIEDDQILKLEGHVWVAGRDPSSEIFIDNGHISRQHFELSRTNEGFFISDLGSANGTLINGHEITANKPHKLNSGDTISIMSIEIYFQLHDPHFQSKLMVIQDLNPSQVPITSNTGQFPQQHHYDGPAVMRVQQNSLSQKKWNEYRLADFKHLNKKQKFRVVIGALGLLVILGLLSGSPEKDDSKEVASKGTHFENLSPEEKEAIKDSFALANSLYTQGKFQLCLAEVKKLHEIIPFYENSKELQAFCNQGSSLLEEKKHKDRLAREQLENERKINQITTQCKKQIKNIKTMDALQQCLGPAMEIDPQHPQIIEIISLMEQSELDAKMKQQARRNRVNRILAGERHYSKARSYYNKGRLRLAIDEYDRYLKRTYPDPNGFKSKARREIASAKSELHGKVSKLLDSCKQDYEKKSYKSAIKQCRGALEEDPKNRDGAGLIEEVLSELRREMKAIYEDAILEESLGNIDAAKEKYRKIMKEDIEEDEYFKKSKRKLKNYGIGI